ncbi:MAG: Phosphoribosylformylglycinamidine synthase 1 [Thermoanaerobacterales bacterium 50_218]|nr:MAG: Phosphoribosylformylglycinamidine synthase 1 [Thermoanaerobacterales bacterium 50_218]HAA90745.1 phosphoribosylformylglycinamidine synthase I [Peptococcaceae bacterium]
MRFGIVVFPGSNCDMDCYHVIDQVLGHPVSYIWHQEKDLTGFDCIILPGGFSYGDYLRSGAIARFSPVMEAVAEFAAKGGLVLGICNGFQILLEAGLLPGAMMRNNCLQFRCQDVYLKVETNETPFTNIYRAGEVIRMPIAHGEGNYYAAPEALAELEENGQVVFRYCTPGGEVTTEANPNGSCNNIAGICNKERNVLGLMPHPERCAEEILGNTDGKKLFLSILSWWEGQRCEEVLGCG